MGATGLRRALRFAPVVRSLIAILRTGTEYIVYNKDRVEILSILPQVD